MKRINVVLSILLSFLLVFSSYGKIENENKYIDDNIDSSSKIIFEKEKSFYKEVNSSWLVIKFLCNEPIVIKKLYITFYSNLTKVRKEDDFYILFDKNHIIYDIGGGGGVYFYSYDDLFLHLNLFFINFTYNHINKGNFSAEGRSWDYNITLPPNTYYLACLGTNGKENNIKVWINVSGDVTFLATAHGNTTYLLDATDFIGKMNVYWYNGSIIRGGRKTFVINNTFIGFLSVEGGIGITKLKIINPKGLTKKAIIFDAGFRRYNFGWGKRRYVIGDRSIYGYMIDGTEGKWTIEINMLESTGLRVETSPDIVFHYGDIILP